MARPSTEPYKGVRDFYPEDQATQNYIFDTWRAVAQAFGYEEYNASILEPTDLYTAKTSEEIINEQTYTFKDRGGRSVTLRPEMTPTVSRMIARKRRELTMPLRWFSVGNMFRYERPQRGRLREHWQLNCDLFGNTSPEADAEIIRVAHTIMTTFGATENDFAIRVNNRSVLLQALLASGMSEQEAERELTRMDKGKGSTSVTTTLDESTKKVLDVLQRDGVTNAVYDPTLVRGFSYYTGVVFEVFDTNSKNKRSLFGGGRYDDLVEKYGGEKVPAVGFAVGDVTMRDFLEVRSTLPKYTPATQLYVCLADATYRTHAQELAQALRKDGVRVAVDMSEKRVGDQVSIADKQHIPYIVCIGEQETSKGAYIVKELATGKEKTLTKEKISDFIKNGK